MRRRHAHLAFGALAAAFAVSLAVQLFLWREARRDARAFAAVPATLPDAGAGAARSAPPGERPHARLAWASALAVGGDVVGAEALFTELARRHGADPIGRAARLGLANRYLREGLASEAGPRHARPLFELAKQGYRDILRVHPGDADARYNLERALRAAPEATARTADEYEPVKRVDVVVPDFVPRDLP